MAENKWNFTEEELLEICGDPEIKKYSVYVTYRLFLSGSTETIHCNYIEAVHTNNYENTRVHVYFNSDNSFPFLGSGFNADALTMIIQLVENEETDNGYKLVSPKSNRWKEIDVTNQVSGGITVANLRTSNLFVSIPPLSEFEDENGDFYTLEYLNYPQNGENKLTFGDEMFLFGNVTTQAEAIAHSTDLPIKLPMNQFNTSTNKTWTEDSSVYITEIGIYDDDDNLVAIAKPTNPIEKNSNISRTIIFSIDF